MSARTARSSKTSRRVAMAPQQRAAALRLDLTMMGRFMKDTSGERQTPPRRIPMLDQPEKTAEYVFPVDGMTCASCSLRVEKALSAVPGVKTAAVNLSAMTARVEAASDVRPADL
ncbi:MAG: heavy-metal-associated domain-containing protein, partial [Hyphomicrobiales bacterium]|nr:heavy-metal-associated domain-containing protein [Hyphomicrobiales bacterium]